MSPKLAQTLYQLGTLVSALLGIALIWGGIDAGAAANIDQIVSGIVSLFGSAAPATAAVRVSKQRSDGTFDPTPEAPEVLSPVDQILTNIPAVIATAQQAVADVDRVKQAATDVLGNLPVFGPDAQAVLARFGL